MAIRVPSVTGPTVRSRALPAPQVRPEPVDNSGLGLLNTGLKAAEAIAQKSADDADTAAVIQAESQLSNWKLNTMFAPETGVYNRKGGNALDITNQTLPQFDQEAERISSSLTNERQRARFQQIASSQRNSLNSELNRYEFGERNQYYDDVDRASLESAQNGAMAYYQDPQQVAYYQNKATRVITAQGLRKGLPPEAIGLEVAKTNSAIATSVIGRMAADDPLKAQQYYAQAFETMTPEDQAQIQKLLGTSVRKQWASQIGAALWASGGVGDSGLPAMIIQAESSGDPLAVSPKGARGLMQLMPDTAKEMAAELGVPYSEERLTADPNYNVTLGTAYLNKMLGRYNGNQALAVAAYNAGPGSVDKWLKENGDPRTGEITEAEWIEKIPFEETRTYTGKIVGQAAPSVPGSVRYADAVKQAQAIEDPEMRDLILNRLDDLKKADDLERQSNYDLAAEAVDEGGYESVDARLLDLLSAEDKVKLKTLDQNLRKGTEPVTDDAKFEEFLGMPSEQLGRLSLQRDIRPYLNNKDFAKVTTAWQKARNGDGDTQASLKAENDAVKSVMGLAGIRFGTSSEAQSEANRLNRTKFESAYNQHRAAFVQKNGVNPTPQEAQKIAEQLLVEVRMPGTGLFSNDIKPVYQVPSDQVGQTYIDPEDIDISELTPNERQAAVERLRATGVQQINDATLTEAYLQLLQARGLKVNR